MNNGKGNTTTENISEKMMAGIGGAVVMSIAFHAGVPSSMNDLLVIGHPCMFCAKNSGIARIA